MSESIKRRPLLHSLSVQLPSKYDEKPFQITNVRRRSRNDKKDLIQTFSVPKEEEEFLPVDCGAENTKRISPDVRAVKKLTEKASGLSEDEKQTISRDNTYENNQNTSRSLLVTAIIENNIDEVANRIEAGDDLDEDINGFKPLHYASKFGRLEAITLLIKAGCDKMAATDDGVTSLHLAVRAGKDDVVSLLLEEGAVSDVREKRKGRTPVHEATLSPNVLVLKALSKKLQEDHWEAMRILKIPDKEGQTALHLGAAAGVTEPINLLLAAGADVAATDNDGFTPMHASLFSHRGNKRCGGVLTQLLEAGGDVDIVGGSNNERLVHFAARAGCSICLDFLRARGADLMAQNELGRTPLHVAAWEGKFDAAKFLMSKGVDLESQDSKGHRPLHLSILSDSPHISTALLDAGANPLAKENDERTYIQLAILWRKMNAFQALVRSKAVHLPEDSGEDIIHYCSALGFVNYVSFLLEIGWDINLKDSKGRTPLHRSLNHGHEELATILTNGGASLHAVDYAGATPLHYAVRWGGSDAILRLMIKKKAQLGVRDRLGRTPLHYAASKFSIMSDLYILLGGGSAIDTTDQMGLTPLHLAARLGNESLVRILLESGARHDIADIDGFLPIDHARENNHQSIIQRLSDHRRFGLNGDQGSATPTKETSTHPRMERHRSSVGW